MRKYITLLRPRHWFKNLFLFAAPFFGGGLFHAETLSLAFPVFIAFSLCASAVYIFNDLIDSEQDRLHPDKRQRPIASGIISRGNAGIAAFILLIISFSLSYAVKPAFFYFVFAYSGIHIAYSLRLKHIALIDIFCISAGFVIRVLAGGAAFNVEVSAWLMVTMFMISLVLASGKRLAECELLNESAGEHRKSLGYYSSTVLNELLLISSAASLISYSLYTIEQFQRLIYTIPVVTFGLFRYIILSKHGMGDPTDAMTKDRLMALTVAAWLLMVGAIRYN
jgi:4-hydroxybenzoate polyprenyltransferase